MSEENKMHLDEFITSEERMVAVVAAYAILQKIEGVTFPEPLVDFAETLLCMMRPPEEEEHAEGLPTWTLRIDMGRTYAPSDEKDDAEAEAEISETLKNNRWISRVLHRGPDMHYPHIVGHQHTVAVPYAGPEKELLGRTIRYHTFSMQGFFSFNDMVLRVLYISACMLKARLIQVFVPGEEKAVLFLGDPKAYVDPFCALDTTPVTREEFFAMWDTNDEYRDSDEYLKGFDLYYADGWDDKRLCDLLRFEEQNPE